MQRRTLLHIATAALPTVLAGCANSSDDATPTANRTATATPTETPTPQTASVVAPIRELWTAYNNENASGVTGAFHPDAPNPPSADQLTFQGDVTIENTTVTEQTSTVATVVGTFTLDSGDMTETQEHTYDVRRHDGEWLIYTVDMGTGESSTSDIPQISFAFEYDSSATADADTGVVTVTHEGGDTADATRLTIRGDGIITPEDAQPDVVVSGTTWAQATGDDSVVAGSDLTVGVSSDCRLSVVWESTEGDTSATLAEFDGPDA